VTFPLRQRPAADYHVRPRSFGAPRGASPQTPGGTREHAGCDLYAPPGTEILAMETGTVTRAGYPFYDVVFALEVTGASGRVIRYGEIASAAPGLALDAQVEEGQVVAHVGKMVTVAQAMLHLEMYDGTGTGPLTDRARAPFMRRADLTDPTAWLDGAGMATTSPA
jgi:murein DD-endopeptidase MepM/ murein hydrolase activator NlpD